MKSKYVINVNKVLEMGNRIASKNSRDLKTSELISPVGTMISELSNRNEASFPDNLNFTLRASSMDMISDLWDGVMSENLS